MKEQYACVETTSSRPTVIECPGLHPLLGASETLALAGARNENGNSYTDSRPTVYPAAESGRGVVHCRIAGPVERLSARALHRGTRSRPKTETDAVHDTGADRRRDAAACRRILVRVCRFVARRRFPDGTARRARSGADWRRDHHHSGADFARMAGHARRVHGGRARPIDPPGESTTRSP